jgi:hypothetical protein
MHRNLSSRVSQAVGLGAVKLTRLFVGHHRISPGRQGSTGHNPYGRACRHVQICDIARRNRAHNKQTDWRLRTRANDIFRSDCKAIHRGIVERGNTCVGYDLFGQHTAQRIQYRDPFGLQGAYLAQDLSQSLIYRDQRLPHLGKFGDVDHSTK